MEGCRWGPRRGLGGGSWAAPPASEVHEPAPPPPPTTPPPSSTSRLAWHQHAVLPGLGAARPWCPSACVQWGAAILRVGPPTLHPPNSPPHPPGSPASAIGRQSKLSQPPGVLQHPPLHIVAAACVDLGCLLGWQLGRQLGGPGGGRQAAAGALCVQHARGEAAARRRASGSSRGRARGSVRYAR